MRQHTIPPRGPGRRNGSLGQRLLRHYPAHVPLQINRASGPFSGPAVGRPRLLALARQVPGFGGFFFDRPGRAHHLSEGGQLHRGAGGRALGPFLSTQRAAECRSPPGAESGFRLDFAGAVAGRGQHRSARDARRGVRGRGRSQQPGQDRRGAGHVGRTDAGRHRAPRCSWQARFWSRRSSPSSTPPRCGIGSGRSRGGVQITLPGFLCTLGFNAIRNGQRSFITNSHCKGAGRHRGHPLLQPAQTVAPTQIATEVADPAYTTGGGCPSGRRCRRSDAGASGLRQRHHVDPRRDRADERSEQRIGPRSRAISRSPRKASASVGQQVHKIGRTTGWTRGSVSNTCVNVNVLGSNVTQLCPSDVGVGGRGPGR